MNEWSPGGNHSSLGTSNQTRRSLQSQREESEKGPVPLVVNVRLLSENRSKTIQQHSMEDVSKTSLATSIKKVGGNGISDPRFKRVISSGVQNDACVGTEIKTPKPLSENVETSTTKFSVRNAAEFKPKKSSLDNKNSKNYKFKLKEFGEPDCDDLDISENASLSQSQDHLKAVDKLSFNHDLVNTLAKESMSECTVNTQNTSLSDDFAHEYSNSLAMVTSATRVKKVQNWIHNQTPKPEKKHSVITVIGQMQEPYALSSALQEIDKRRKLVKELDRYAVCKKIIEADKEKEICDILKINSLSNSKRGLFSESSETINSDPCSTKVCEDKINKHSNILNAENNLSNCNDITALKSVTKKHSSVKEKLLKSHSKTDCFIQGKLRMIYSSLLYQRMFCIILMMSGIISWFAFFAVQNGAFVSLDLFNSKPKPVSWYERIFEWLWEFFRPSDNYHRTKTWPSY